MTARKCNVGFIGCGRLMNWQHIQNAHKSDACAVHTLCDITPEALERTASKYPPQKRTADYRTLLADDEVDLVVIATNADFHARFAVEALRAGKHVYVEKPLGRTVEEGREVARAAKEAERHVAVGFNRRFAPAYLDVKAALEAREGPPMFYYRIADHEQGRRTGISRLLDEICHIFDILVWFAGAEPASVYAAEGFHHNDNLIALKFADGSTAAILSSGRATAELPKEHLEVVWDHHAVVVEDFVEARFFDVEGMPPLKRYRGRAYDGGPSEHVERFAEDGLEALVELRRRAREAEDAQQRGESAPEEIMRLPINYIEDKGWAVALDEMAAAAVEGRAPRNASAVDGLRATAVALAAMRSVETGKAAELDPAQWSIP